jgi:NTE family protein
MQTPDALVLGGGGILGEAWMNAVLAGIEELDDFDARECACYVGTSAGSIVAASLVAGLAPGARLGALSPSSAAREDDVEEPAAALAQAFAAAVDLAGALAAPVAAFASASSSAGGAMLRRALLRRVPIGERSLADLGRQVELAGVRWDGRLRIVAVEQDTGRRVVFGAPDAPELSVAGAVQASCAIPGVFRPLHANGHAYVDGGVWSPTNMDVAAAARGSRLLCLNPTGSLRPAFGTITGVFGPVSRTVAGAEALVLRNRGVSVTTINPDAASASAMGANLMDHARRDDVIAAGLAQGRRLAPGDQRRAA